MAVMLGVMKRKWTIPLMLVAPFPFLYLINSAYSHLIGYFHHEVVDSTAPFMNTVLNYTHSCQLILVVAALGMIGLLIIYGIRGLWFSIDGSKPLVHAVFIGQLAVLIYVYLRSYLNYLTGVVIPITIIDFVGIIVLLLAIFYKKKEIVPFIREMNQNIGGYLITLYFIWLLFLIIANKELPRIAMLSSDPDEHVFFAQQLIRFHTLPYTQFFWGNEPFHYPGGFAVLNFIWSTISFLDVRNVVTAQRLIQTQLAIIILAECAWSVGNRSFIKKRIYFTFLCLIFCVYYFVLPEGFERAFFYQEHTPLLSTLFFVSMGFSFLFFVWMNKRNSRYRESLNVPLNAAAIIMTISALILIHPVTVFYAVILGCIGIIVMWGGNRKGGGWIKAAAALPLAAFPLLDPFYRDILFGFFRSGTHIAGFAGVSGSFKIFISILVDSVWDIGSLFSIFQTGLLDNALNIFLIVLMLSCVLLVCYRKYLEKEFISLIVLIGLFLMLSSVLLIGFLNACIYSSTLLPGAVNVAGSGGVSWQSLMLQLPAYVTTHAAKYTILWCFLGIGTILASLAKQFDYKKVVLGTLIFIFCIVVISSYGQGKTDIYLPRKYMSGTLGEVTEDDLFVINKVEGLFKKYREEGGSLDYRTVPRILILNQVCLINNEIWLFPHGASRILPLYDVFPVSFFYYQGMDVFSYENYMQHVHDTLDEEWLRRHNIRYLFIPSDKGEATIETLDSLTINMNMLFEKNGCKFIQLTQ